MQRRRTLQGGTGRSATYGGTPNARGWGITQKFLGSNPIPSSRADGGFGAMSRDPASFMGGMGTRNPGQSPPIVPRQGGGGGFPMPRMPQQYPGGGGGGFPRGYPGQKMPPQGGGGQQGPGGRKGGGLGGGVGGGKFALPYDRLIHKLGLPMDPMFEAQRTALLNARDAQRQGLQSQRDVGMAALDEQSLLGNRQIDEEMAARGIFGSGIEDRSERLLGNDIARDRLGLIQDFFLGRQNVGQEFRSGLQGAMFDLANRMQGQPGLPLPTWGPWANLGRDRRQGRQGRS